MSSAVATASATATVNSLPPAWPLRLPPTVSFSGDDAGLCSSPLARSCHPVQRGAWKTGHVRCSSDAFGAANGRPKGPAKDPGTIEARRGASAAAAQTGTRAATDPRRLHKASLEALACPCSDACIQVVERGAVRAAEGLFGGASANAQALCAGLGARVARRMEERHAALAAVRRAAERRRSTRTRLELAAGVPRGCPLDAKLSTAEQEPTAHKSTPPSSSTGVSVPAAPSTGLSGKGSDSEVPARLGQSCSGTRGSGGERVSPTGDAARGELFGIVASLANDPPLMFSGEVLGVLGVLVGGRKSGAAGGAGGDDDDDEGVSCPGGYGPEAEGVVEAVASLGRYYARVKGRATILSKTNGTPMLEKLIRSLAPTLDHMEVMPSETNDFLRDVALFLVACFREINPQMAAKSSSSKRRVGSESSGGGDVTGGKYSRRSSRIWK